MEPTNDDDLIPPEQDVPHTFYLVRSDDVSGVSGVGIVAEGVQFSAGKVALCWLTDPSSVAVYESVADVKSIHGHDGRTKVVWITQDGLGQVEFY